MSLVRDAQELLMDVCNMKERLEQGFSDSFAPVNQRWELYLLWCQLGSSAAFCCAEDPLADMFGFEIIGYDGIYHVDRYQTVEFLDLFERVLETIMYPTYATDSDSEKAEKIVQFRKDIGNVDDMYDDVVQNHPLVLEMKVAIMDTKHSQTVRDW